MLEALLKILALDLPSPEIMLEEDGCLGLTWMIPKGAAADISIWPDGKLSWAIEGGGRGTAKDYEQMVEALKKVLL